MNGREDAAACSAAAQAIAEDTRHLGRAVEEARAHMPAGPSSRFASQYERLVRLADVGDSGAERLAALAAELFAFDRAALKAMQRMDLIDAERFAGYYSWYRQRTDGALAAAGMSIVDLTGRLYTVGMAATALNIDEYDDEELIVAQMIEPIVMLQGSVMRLGKVMLAPAQA